MNAYLAGSLVLLVSIVGEPQGFPDSTNAARAALAAPPPQLVRPRNLPFEEHIARVIGPDAVNCGTFEQSHNGMALPPRKGSKATSKRESMYESLQCGQDASTQKRGFRIVQKEPGMHGFRSA